MSKQANQTSHEQLLANLQNALLSFKPAFTQGISEFEIITRLKNPPFEIFSDDALRDSLVLFQSHFVLFHSLYLLKQQWREQEVGELEILATCIKLHPLKQKHAGQNIEEHDNIAAYYLNWQNLLQTEQKDVNDLLDSFWQKMSRSNANMAVSDEALQQARAQLALPLEGKLSADQLKLQYRKLQHEHHPDKGGDIAHSQAIQKAYTLLHSYIKNS